MTIGGEGIQPGSLGDEVVVPGRLVPCVASGSEAVTAGQTLLSGAVEVIAAWIRA